MAQWPFKEMTVALLGLWVVMHSTDWLCTLQGLPSEARWGDAPCETPPRACPPRDFCELRPDLCPRSAPAGSQAPRSAPADAKSCRETCLTGAEVLRHVCTALPETLLQVGCRQLPRVREPLCQSWCG
jgi:hypothetical protein